MPEDNKQELKHKTRELLALRRRADELSTEITHLEMDVKGRFDEGVFDTNCVFMADLFQILVEEGPLEDFGLSLRDNTGHPVEDFEKGYRESLNIKIAKSGARLQVPVNLFSYLTAERDARLKELDSGEVDFSRLENMIAFFQEVLSDIRLKKHGHQFPGPRTMVQLAGGDQSAVIRDLKGEAESLKEKFQRRYGAEAFTGNPQLAETFFHIAASGLIELLWHIHCLKESDLRLPEFQRRYLATASQSAGEGETVPLDPFDYVDRGLEAAQQQKRNTEMTEYDPVEQLVSGLAQVLDHDMLAPFRTGEEDSPAGPKLKTKLLGLEDANKEVLPRPFNEVYDLIRLVGEGGFARVYEALHKSLKVKRALKLIKMSPDHPEYTKFAERMAREGEVQAKLKEHPNIVRLLDGGESPDGYFLVMDYVAGARTLRELINDHKQQPDSERDRKMSAEKIIDIMIGVIRGVAHAHRSGVIHRDLKPENIMLDSTGTPKVADFGLAHSVDVERLTQQGEIFATPEYAAPERAWGKTETVATDIYSLGVVMYELALNNPPFTGENLSVLYAQSDSEVIPIEHQRDDFYEPLAGLIHRCLAKKPEDRPLSADVILRELEQFKEDLETSSKRAARRPGRARRYAGVAVLVLLFAAAALFAIFGLPNDDDGAGDHELSFKPEDHEKDPDKNNNKEEPKKEERKKDDPKKEEPKKDEPGKVDPKKEEPKKEEPKKEEPKSYQPSNVELALLAKIPDFFEARSGDLSKRSYSGLKTDLAGFREDAAQTDYTREKIEKILQLPDLAEDAVSKRHRNLMDTEKTVTVLLRDGSELTGERVDKKKTSFTLKLENGSTVDVRLEDLATADFLRDPKASERNLAFSAIDRSAAKALEKILAAIATDKDKEEDLLPWIAPLVRLARTQMRAAVPEAWNLRSKPRGKAASAFIRESAEICANHRDTLLQLDPYVSQDLEHIRREAQAFELLSSKKYATALKSYPQTAAYPLAAAQLHADFVAKLQENLFDTGEAWWQMWKLDPELANPDPNILTTDTDYDAIVLRDWEGKRSLVLVEPSSAAPKGLHFRFRYYPANKVKTPYWALTISGKDTFLRQDAKELTLHSGGKILARYEEKTAPKAGTERTVSLFPDSGALWVYLDGELVFFVSLDQVQISTTPRVCVFGAELKLKELRTR